MIDIDLAQVARELNLPLESVHNTVALLDDGNTVPFITRYRKDQTGALHEDQIRRIQGRVGKLRALEERKRTVLRSVQSQGQLTAGLAEQIRAANSSKRLEDLYLPFKPKKLTLATVARQNGLEPLATRVLNADPLVADLEEQARQLIVPDRGLASPDDVLAGVRHIIAEWFSERADVRGKLRNILFRSGRLICNRIDTATTRDTASASRHSDPAAADLPVDQSVEQPVEASGIDASVVGGEGEAHAPVDADVHVEAGVGPADMPFINPDDSPPAKGDSAAPASAVDDHSPCSDAVEPMIVPTDSGDAADPFPPEPVTDVEPVTDAEPAVDVEPMAAVASVPVAEPGVVPDSKSPLVRAGVAKKTFSKRGPLAAAITKNQKKEKKRQKMEAAFKDYFQFQEAIARIPPHRVLAINRGERARFLRVKIEGDLEAMSAEAETLLVPTDHPHGEFLRNCVRDALVRLIVPSLERELRREMMERSEEHAVEVFARNLRKLLLQPPVHDHRVLAIDPGFRSGCKLIALDEFGNVLGHDIIHVIGKEEWIRSGRMKLVEIIRRHQLTVIAIGNGAACRETEQLVVDVMATELQGEDVAFLIVYEAGASVYSTSPLGREELPSYDPVLRSAVSIGRRLLDPLSELVKINPANIGVGMYQHDVKAKHLRNSLDAVVESCVNYVGVDANTASPALLRYVSGMNQLNARRLVEYRSTQGPFRNREQLRQVPGLGDAAFVQAAGFLMVTQGDNPLDTTWIHPESYDVAMQVLERVGCGPADLAGGSAANRSLEEGGADAGSLRPVSEKVRELDVEALAEEWSVSPIVLRDIVHALARPGRDPREDFPAPVFRRGILRLEDLAPGMKLSGTVLNVVDFGAFVDIGLSDSGLVHISRLADRFVRDPHEVVGVGDVLTVWVVEVDKQRRRVSLTAIEPGTEKSPEARRESPRSSGHRPSRQRESDGAGRGERRARAAGGKRSESRRPARPSRPPQRPKIITPLTKEMEEGKAPLRSFSDLMQFYQKKHTDEDDSQS